MAGSDGVMGLMGISMSMRRYISPNDNGLVSRRADTDVIRSNKWVIGEYVHIEIFDNESF